jgi:ketosteroid isomerase-like protein
MVKSGAILNDIYDAWRAQNLDWLATYLPDDFCHVLHLPGSLHPRTGMLQGKQAVLDRWQMHIDPLEFLLFDTSGLMIENDRAAVEIPLRYRHKATGKELVTVKANIWVLEEGWPVKLIEYFDIGTISKFVESLQAAEQGSRSG